MKLSIGSSLLLLSVALTACSYLGSSDPLNTTPPKFNKQKVQTEPLTFENLSKTVFESKCLTCHHDHEYLRTASGVQARKRDITNMVFVTGRMPPKKKEQLTECEIDILREYLEHGDQPDKKVSELDPCKG